jgi:hypothetical protein
MMVLLMCSYALSAQAGLGAAGGHVASDELGFSYSVGQVFNLAIKQSDYYITQGIQHPVWMRTSDIPPVVQAPLKLDAYPNPVTRELYIRLEDAGDKGCILQLLNMSGKVMIERFVGSEEYVLSLEAFEAGCYLLRFIPSESAPRTFKIIKTE